MKTEEEIREALAKYEKSYEDAIMGNYHSDDGVGERATTWQEANINAIRWILDMPKYKLPDHVSLELDLRNAEAHKEMDECYMKDHDGKTIEQWFEKTIRIPIQIEYEKDKVE